MREVPAATADARRRELRPEALQDEAVERDVEGDLAEDVLQFCMREEAAETDHEVGEMPPKRSSVLWPAVEGGEEHGVGATRASKGGDEDLGHPALGVLLRREL